MIRANRTPANAAAFAIAALTCLFLGSCNPATRYARPTVPVPTAYKETAPQAYKEGTGWIVANPGDDKIRPKWWEMYNDAQLNQLEEQVAISNQTVIQAEANFRSAQALVAQARSALFPVIGSSASYSRQHFPSTSKGYSVLSQSSGGTGTGGTTSGGTGTTTGSGSSGSSSTTGTAGGLGTFNEYSAAANISYSLDLWHKIRNTIAANAFAAQASAADVATALLTTQAELAQDYFEVRALDAEEAIYTDMLRNFRQTLELTESLFRLGIDSELDVSQAQTQLDTATAQATDIGVARAQYEHAISTLIGKPPAAFALAVAPFTPNPPAVPVALPSVILQRRPDIAAAERLVAQQNALIGVARAAYYPNITLSATAGFESSSISNWFTWPSRLWSLGPSLSETLLDFGARRAAVQQSEAAYDAAVASYRQTVLGDFQTVEDNLAALRILANEVAQYKTAVTSAGRYLDLAIELYRTGVDSYLTVVAAQNTLLSNRETQVQTELRQMTASVALVMALGGGWDESRLAAEQKTLETPVKWAPATSVQPQTPVSAPNPPTGSANR